MNNRDAKKQNKNGKSDPNSVFFSYLVKFILFSSLLAFFGAWYTQKLLMTPPETPKLDPQEWWGPYPVDMKADQSIRPYKIEFSDVMIHDLRERLLHRRPFTTPLENVGFTYGFNSKYLNQVLDYWHNSYNFKERERHLNKFNHYKTKIQGLDIHYMHIMPEDTDNVEVVPLLMLHGWPGSVAEFYEIIPKLTAIRSGHSFVFEIIAPSLPGFGFSQGAARPGLGPAPMAVIMNNLMQRLGHEKYYIQGGDVGHTVGSIMASLYQDNVLGFHTNFPVLAFNTIALGYVVAGSLWPRTMVEPEQEARMYPLSDYVSRTLEESGYMHIQATKPDTVGVGLSDSPAGLAAYILEKFSTWTNPENKKAGDGNLLDKFLLTHLLDNVMIYWVTNSITTSMRVYKETFSSEMVNVFEMIPTEVPTCGIKFKYELMYQPDSILELKYHKYLHSTVVETGGHFAAMENPDIMAEDIFYAVSTFRKYHHKHGTTTLAPSEDEPPTSVYDFTVKDLHGREVKLEKYRGKILVIVNVASECGLTETNYKQLNELHMKYYNRGLRILAFPCNQFGGQEPGNAKEILTFASKKDVKFDMFEKIEVNGENANPLWKFLKKTQGGTLGDFIKWNFSKFIVDKNGVPVERLAPNVTPLELEPYLAKYW